MSLVSYSLQKILNSSIIENIMIQNNSVLVKFTYQTTKYLLNFYYSDTIFSTILIYGGMFLLNGIKIKLNLLSIELFLKLLSYLSNTFLNNIPLQKIEQNINKIELLTNPIIINNYDNFDSIYKENYII